MPPPGSGFYIRANCAVDLGCIRFDVALSAPFLPEGCRRFPVEELIPQLVMEALDVASLPWADGLFAMHDHLRDNGHPIALVMVTNQENPAWLADADPIRSLTLRIIRVSHVSAEEILGLMPV